MDAEEFSLPPEASDSQPESFMEGKGSRSDKRADRKHRQGRSGRLEPAGPLRGSLTGLIGFLAVAWLIRESSRRRRQRHHSRSTRESTSEQTSGESPATASVSESVTDVGAHASGGTSGSRAGAESNHFKQERPSWRVATPDRSSNVPPGRDAFPHGDESHRVNQSMTPSATAEPAATKRAFSSLGTSGREVEAGEPQRMNLSTSAGDVGCDSGAGSRLWSMIESERRSVSLVERASTGDGQGRDYAEQLVRDLVEMRTTEGKDKLEETQESSILSASMLSTTAWLDPSTAGASSSVNAALEASRERVIVTDESNEPLRVVTRAEMRRENLWHRATYVLVLTPGRDRIYIQKRTMTKDIHPGMYDAAAGGVVKAGETYEESAKRELLEELGLDLPLEPVGPIRYDTDVTRVFGQVFVAIFDPFQEPRQRIRPQAEEVELVELVPVSEVLLPSEERVFTEDTLLALRTFVEKQNAKIGPSASVAATSTRPEHANGDQSPATGDETNEDQRADEPPQEHGSSMQDLTDETASSSRASTPNTPTAGSLAAPPPTHVLTENPSPPPIESFIDDMDPASVEARSILQSLRPTP